MSNCAKMRVKFRIEIGADWSFRNAKGKPVGMPKVIAANQILLSLKHHLINK